MTAEVRGIVGKLQENIKKLSEGERKKEENMEELENQMVCFGANLTRQMRGVTWMVKLEVMLSKDSKTLHGMDGRIGPVAGWKPVRGWSRRASGHISRPANHYAEPKGKIVMDKGCEQNGLLVRRPHHCLSSGQRPLIRAGGSCRWRVLGCIGGTLTPQRLRFQVFRCGKLAPA